jgi:hypothetical protein
MPIASQVPTQTRSAARTTPGRHPLPPESTASLAKVPADASIDEFLQQPLLKETGQTLCTSNQQPDGLANATRLASFLDSLC